MKTRLLFTLLAFGMYFIPELNAQTTATGQNAVVYGCMNPKAKNYNPLATKDNGTCVFDSTNKPPVVVIAGCMNPKAINFNKYARVDNGSCVFDSTKIHNDSTKNHLIYGCTDSTALNYNPHATINTHNCIYKKVISGCTDSLALNFNPNANVDNGKCRYIKDIWGCTDSLALNYNPKANKNSGYCVYTKPVPGCTDKTALNYNPKATVENRSCIFLSNDSIAGCTDPLALNFNKYAKKDNGKCKYPMVSDSIKGCTDSTALNFNPVASKPGRCVYARDSAAVAGCKSPKALNYNPLATHNDGSCIFARPINTKFQAITTELLADTLGKVLYAACNFDYTLTVDTVYIVKATRLKDKNVELIWAIKQGSVITNVTSVIKMEKQGIELLYLSLVCNQGVSAAAKVSSAIDLTNSSTSIATDKVKGVTVSAYFANKIIAGLTNSLNKEYGISIYPNPVVDQMNLNYTGSDNDCLKINIHSIDGRKMISNDVVSNIGENTFQINTTTLKSGLHFISIEKNGVIIETIKFSKF